jgi:TPR repeat protein
MPPELPKPPAPAMLTLALVALTGIVVGTVLQEFRWRNSVNSSEGDLAYAERAFQNGDDQTALNLFSKLATHNNPNAEYWLGHMYEIGLGIPRDRRRQSISTRKPPIKTSLPPRRGSEISI